MIKIYVETITRAIVMLKNDKIENHLEHVEHLLSAIGNITGQKVLKYTKTKGSKIIIELNLLDENIDNINESLEKLKTKNK